MNVRHPVKRWNISSRVQGAASLREVSRDAASLSAAISNAFWSKPRLKSVARTGTLIAWDGQTISF
jgi:hypothetical protein